MFAPCTKGVAGCDISASISTWKFPKFFSFFLPKELLWITQYFINFSLLLTFNNPPVTPLYSLTIWAIIDCDQFLTLITLNRSLFLSSPLFLSYLGWHYHLHRSSIQPIYPRVPELSYVSDIFSTFNTLAIIPFNFILQDFSIIWNQSIPMKPFINWNGINQRSNALGIHLVIRCTR